MISPSGCRADGTVIGEPATPADLDAVVASFARAARDTQLAGFDGVELHGAHGYLLDQFLWAGTNVRGDAYGGSPANRARLGAEVVSAVRASAGPRFPILFRFSQWKGGHFDARIADTPGELEQILAPLVDAGVSALHVSTRRYWTPAFEGSSMTLAGWTKKVTGLPVVAIGSVGVAQAFRGENEEPAPARGFDTLLELFERGEFDLVAMGRALLSEPAWPTRFRDGRLDEIRPYDKADEDRLL